MPPAFEFSIEPGSHDFESDTLTDDPLAHDQDIGIVVQTAHPRRKMVMAERGTHVRVPVGDYGHTDTRTANQDTTVHTLVRDRLRHLFPVIRIINGGSACGSEVHKLDILDCFDEFCDLFFQFPTAVVAGYRQFHVKKPFSLPPPLGGGGIEGRCDDRVAGQPRFSAPY